MESYPSTDDLIGNFYTKAAVARDLAPEEFELIGKARIGTEKLEIPVESIEHMEVGENQGTIIMHLRQEAADHKIALIVSGATLLSLGAFALKKRHSK